MGPAMQLRHVQHSIELAVALVGRVDMVIAWRDSISIHVQVHTLLVRETSAVRTDNAPLP